MPRVLWWGRFDANYSRNRILRHLFAALGWSVSDFHPRLSICGDLEALWRRLPRPDLLWVPCFRQRDLSAAHRWARRLGVPLVFDPLISAYDKQVYERHKFAPVSPRAKRLHAWEQRLFQEADLLIADTAAHGDYFAQEFGPRRDRIQVIHVGAEEPLFHPAPMPEHDDGSLPEVLFYGSFIALQGPQIIVEAARLYHGPPVRWTLLGRGPLRGQCERLAKGIDHLRFEDSVPLEHLPARIHQADLLLGIFDGGLKAARVIPNKVYQSLACGRPVITRRSDAFPDDLMTSQNTGLIFVPAGDPACLAQEIALLMNYPQRLMELGNLARQTFFNWFGQAIIARQLDAVITRLVSKHCYGKQP